MTLRVSLGASEPEPVPETTPSRAVRTAGIVALAAWSAWWAWRSWGVSGLSWHYFESGGDALLHGSGLAVYVDQPTLQVGPLALLVAAGFAALPGGGLHAAQVVMAATGPLLLVLLFPLAEGRRAAVRFAVAAALVVPAWMVLAVRWGHLDDVLAMAGAVLAVRAVARDRAALAALGLAVAVCAKPWAVGFVPVLLGLSHGRWRALVGTAVAAVVAWLPFVVAEPGTIDALRPPVPLIPGSGLHTLGVRGRYVPDWGRTLQLGGTMAAGLAAAVLGRWPGVLLSALAVRIVLDPQDNPYYLGSAALAAATFDIVGTRWSLPWTTVLTVAALWQPFTADYAHRLDDTRGLALWWFTHSAEVGWLHLAWAVAVIGLVLVAPRMGDTT